MPLDLNRARPLLEKADLTKLFVDELGWEPCRQKLTLTAAEKDHLFTAVAQKKGFTVWLCEAPDGSIPDHATRLKLDRALTQTSYEHLTVFITKDRSRQLWMWVRREKDKPLAARTHEFFRGQPGDSLLQKLEALYVSLEDEENISLSKVTKGAKKAFDVEKVTKAFYKNFDDHRKAFLRHIDGIPDTADREWYASVMLNRLMFVYFIQRKGFLDRDPDYLHNRLRRCQEEKGKDKFYSFYRTFLLRLFHEGLGESTRPPELEKLIGRIPYLNGGIFDVHDLERRYGDAIQISDDAFRWVFTYFDTYQWHLDDRPLKSDREINPDVLGYIFEKYINQKQMGAYYTKEDITEYIGKNCIIPFLFDSAKAKCAIAFEKACERSTGFQPVPASERSAGILPASSSSDGQDGRAPFSDTSVWRLLREDPDRYIYPAVRHGTHLPLPPEIAAGLDTSKPGLIERRKAWNKPAPADYALPTEIWRETVARRLRYWEVWSRLSGRIAQPSWVAHPPTAEEAFTSSFIPHPSSFGINDFITLNLDLRQFAQDVIENCEGPDLLSAFWQAVSTITVLDPTGGSGAFIFAALNLLEPLYEACLDRMSALLAAWGDSGRKTHPNYHKRFTELLANVAKHPNRRYFILKSIILNNLYAVDIMEEAVEICKLRLFLKLASQVEPDESKPNLGIEPLPDIDFNIRAGNTLVGYATYDEVKKAVDRDHTGQAMMQFDDAMGKIETKAADVQHYYDTFRLLQMEGDGSVPHEHKLELHKRLKVLDDELNLHLAKDYGEKVNDKTAYAKWLKSHQPFHWFVQFYGILKNGGFDVIIGNPPYVEMVDVAKQYSIKNFTLFETGNLFSVCMERFIILLRSKGKTGVIVPISSISTPRMLPLMQLMDKSFSPLHVSNFAVRPGKLFIGVDMNLSIIIGEKKNKENTSFIFATGYNRWNEQGRSNLFQSLEYAKSSLAVENSGFLKIGRSIEQSILDKTGSQPSLKKLRSNSTDCDQVYYHSGGRYFRKCIRKQLSNEYKELGLLKGVSNAVICLISSSLYYWTWIGISDCYHVIKRDIDAGSIPNSFLCDYKIKDLSEKLLVDLWKNSETRIRNRADGSQREEINFYVGKSKPIIDEIDTLLAQHYGFTEEELDFIINYDIKYRMGRGGEEEES